MKIEFSNYCNDVHCIRLIGARYRGPNTPKEPIDLFLTTEEVQQLEKAIRENSRT